jgi:competence protein ComFC
MDEELVRSNTIICSNCKNGFVPVSFNKCITIDKQHYMNYTTLFLYDFTLKQALKRFKFYKEVRLRRLFENYFLEHLNLLNPPDIIVPVPSHPLTNIKRGYIPMFLLAKTIGSVSGIPVSYLINKCFFKIFNQSQKSQNREQRLSRMGNRFYISAINRTKAEGQKILLLDDVITTGTTITECAELLYRYGAKDVSALVLAATPI